MKLKLLKKIQNQLKIYLKVVLLLEERINNLLYRRKSSSAVVTLRPGTGKITINKRNFIDVYLL